MIIAAAYALFRVFRLCSAMQSLDNSVIKAAEEIAGPWRRTHGRVLWPHGKLGSASNAVKVFTLSAGSFWVPSLLRSTTSGWPTQTIQGTMMRSQNWKTGAACDFRRVQAYLLVPFFVMGGAALSASSLPRALQWKGLTDQWFIERQKDSRIRTAFHTTLVAIVAAHVAVLRRRC